MDFDETMVEEEFDDVEVDDTLPDDIIEEDESEEEEFPDEEELDIGDLDDDSEEKPEEKEAPADDEPPANEPGWMKKRIGKAVEKAVNAALAKQAEQFEAQMRPFRERMIEEEAQELLRNRKVADIETARELVKYRHGQASAPEEPKQEQPRNERGQFTSQEQIVRDARIQERVEVLSRQADKIKANGGPDVVKEFTENPDIKRRVVEGELDMYDVAEIMRNRKNKKPPTPTRSPNGATNYAPNAFSNMSSKQFAKFEEKLREGGRFTFKN